MLESPRGLALLWHCVSLALVGRTSEAFAGMEEADKFLRGRGLKETLSWSAWCRFVILRVAGVEMGQTDVEIAREAHALGEAIGGPLAKMVTQTTLSAGYLGAGRPADAVQAAHQGITVIEASDIGRDFEGCMRYLHSLALTEAGDPLRGLAEAERAIRRCLERGNRLYRPWSCAAFALAAAVAGTELDRALEVLDDGERIVAETGARGFLPELLDARARVHAARGEHAARRKTLLRGLQVASENQAQGWENRFRDAVAGRGCGAFRRLRCSSHLRGGQPIRGHKHRGGLPDPSSRQPAATILARWGNLDSCQMLARLNEAVVIIFIHPTDLQSPIPAQRQLPGSVS
jgi:hypothetical protein